MTSFKKAVENLRPQLVEIGSNEAFFEANGEYGDPETREENLEHAKGYMREFTAMKATMTAIFPNIDSEKVHKALFDIYFDSWITDKIKFKERIQSLYSEDTSV